MAVTIAPSTEACQAIVARINSGTTYPLLVQAQYAEQFNDDAETLEGLAVDVIQLDEVQMQETLATEDRTEHTIAVEIRKKLTTTTQQPIDQMKLVTRQIYQRLNDYDSANGRVQVWEAAFEVNENPNKTLLADRQIFRSRLLLKVRVSPSP